MRRHALLAVPLLGCTPSGPIHSATNDPPLEDCVDGCTVRPSLQHVPVELEYQGYFDTSSAVWLHDQDGDGDDEVAVAAYTVGVFEGGVQSDDVRATLDIPGGTGLLNLTVVGDLDGNGESDVIATGPDFAGFAVLGTTPGAVGLHVVEVVERGSSLPEIHAASPGDLDGDGLDELAVSLEGGPVDVYPGSDVGGTAGWTVQGPYDEDFGMALEGCDIDGDGLMDLLVGAPGAPSAQGAVYVVHNTGSGLVLGGRGRLEGVPAGVSDRFGIAITCLGDLDGDGSEDFAAGAPLLDGGTVAAFRGADPPVLWQTWTVDDTTGAGRSLSGGRIEDTLPVVITGHDLARGYASILSLDSTIPSVRLDPPLVPEVADTRVDFGGDWDGDGCADLLVVDQDVLIHRGCTSDADGDGVAAGNDCDDNNRQRGWPDLVAVDEDGDGHPWQPEYRCEIPEGWIRVTKVEDCDDRDPDIHPGATDQPGDDVDNDCDGVEQSWCAHAGGPASWIWLLLVGVRSSGVRSGRRWGRSSAAEHGSPGPSRPARAGGSGSG